MELPTVLKDKIKQYMAEIEHRKKYAKVLDNLREIYTCCWYHEFMPGILQEEYSSCFTLRQSNKALAQEYRRKQMLTCEFYRFFPFIRLPEPKDDANFFSMY